MKEHRFICEEHYMQLFSAKAINTYRKPSVVLCKDKCLSNQWQLTSPPTFLIAT